MELTDQQEEIGGALRANCLNGKRTSNRMNKQSNDQGRTIKPPNLNVNGSLSKQICVCRIIDDMLGDAIGNSSDGHVRIDAQRCRNYRTIGHVEAWVHC